ncbi:unnamed protein product [Litomosoides sigmodontis]|uniref:DNA polymerase alpha subunit B n=1 Tax=Litomosoides sigmodontis TaxID=42156 RepID=A0A3P6TBS8_LITSI|nr:unnamed protein product [Litomosoides sigmodontis]
MNARSHQFQLTVDEHQVRDAISTVFHTILLHRSVPKVRVNSPKLVSCLHEEIDSFVQCIRHSIESVTAPRFYSPPPVSLLTHYGTPLLNAKIDLEFYQRKKRSWPLSDYEIPWEIWQMQIGIVRIKEREYWERMREEVADSVSEVVLKACSLISRPQYMPQMPTRSEVASVFDTSFLECQPYLFRVVKHPLDSGQNTESTLMTIGASAVKKMLRDTFLSVMDDDYIAESYGCMTADWLNEQLADFMYTFENDSDGIFVAKANDLSKQYCQRGEDFVSELIAFATNQNQTHVNLSMLDSFEQLVLHKAAQNCKNESFNISSTKIAFSERNKNSWLDENSTPGNLNMDFSNESFSLPEKYLAFTPIRKSLSDAAYQSRKDSGKIIVKLTGKNFTAKRNGAKGSNVCKVTVEKLYTNDYKNLIQYGAEKDLEQIEALVSRVRKLCNIIKEENEILADDEQVDSLSLIGNTYFGFIVNNTEDPLDVSNCSLQCIDQNTDVINLDLSNLKAYSLFPGKIVALRGSFAGDAFMPDEIFEPKEPSIAPLKKQSDIDFLHVWCACGPFTSSKTLSYEQLCDLIELVRKERPDILILVGPFIDRTSPAVKSPQCCYTYSDLMDMLLAKIDDCLSGTDVQVLIVPNGRKDAALRPSFPTPPFLSSKQRKQQLIKNIVLLPDPAIVRIAGVEFAVTGSEIIQHLGREEIGLDNCEDQDRVSRLVRDLFRQRSLYPLYPAAHDVTYRLREAVERTSLSVIPHIIILPSILAPTIKVVAGSLFVNTNALVRGSSGTFMKLKIDLKEIDESKENSHASVADFCEVQIVRL